MARMRTIKPEAATSETLAQVPRDVRWTFGMFWTHCDDDGRAVWNTRIIKAAIYPLDDDVTLDVLAHEFNVLECVGAVCFYEVDGREYVHVPAFGEHQHPNRRVDSKLPPCPKTDHSPPPHTHSSEGDVSAPPRLTPVVVVVGGDVEVGGEEGAQSATPSAQTIVAEWIDRSAKRPPERVVGQVARLTGEMLAERNLDPDAEPLNTIVADGAMHALVTRHYGIEGGDAARHTKPSSEALRTMTANGGNMSLLLPYYSNADAAKPADEPIGTLTTRDRYALIHRHNSGGAEMLTPSHEVLRTLTTKGHQSIITPGDLEAAEAQVDDCMFRMFEPHEVAAGMAFPADYQWQPNPTKKISRRDLVKAAGNAVTPPAARDLMCAVVESLGGVA